MLKKIGPVAVCAALALTMMLSETSPTLATVHAPAAVHGVAAPNSLKDVAEALGAGLGGGVAGAILGGLACFPAGAVAAFTDGFVYGTAGDVGAQLLGHQTEDSLHVHVGSTTFDH